jgi:hypothetical protein
MAKARAPSAPAAIGVDEDHMRKYRAKDAFETLTRAEEFKRDKSLMKDVKAHARNHAKVVAAVISPKRGR